MQINVSNEEESIIFADMSGHGTKFAVKLERNPIGEELFICGSKGDGFVEEYVSIENEEQALGLLQAITEALRLGWIKK